jgi:hypothetical protein
MEEIHARKIARDLTAFLVDIVRLARDIGVMADDDERLGADWYVRPRQMRIDVASQRNVALAIGFAKGIALGYAPVIRKRLAG